MREVGRVVEREILIHKFGGSSLATFADIRRFSKTIRAVYHSGQLVVAVVSARGNHTDDLLALARGIGEAGPASALQNAREVDQLLATGEVASAALCAIALAEQGIPAVSLCGCQIGITVSGPPGHGIIEKIDTSRIVRLLAAGNVVVVAGFQGVNSAGDIATLGRGGSDTTAVALAVALGQQRCRIYTDVDGICTADPRIVPSATPLAAVEADVLTELAIAGAEVVHPRAAEIAAAWGVDLQVSSSFTPGAGTTVRATAAPDSIETGGRVVAIADDGSVARLRVHPRTTNPHGELFRVLAAHAVAVDMVDRHADGGITFTIPRDDVASVHAMLTTDGTLSAAEIEVDDNVAMVSLVGNGLLSNIGYVSRTLAALAGLGVHTGSLSSSQSRISVLVPSGQMADVVRALHREFIFSPGEETAGSMTYAYAEPGTTDVNF